MILELKIPSPGESITEVEIARWFIENGDIVSADQEIGEIESEKATLPLIAEAEGKAELLVNAGETVKVGSVVCKIDTSFSLGQKKQKPTSKSEDSTPLPEKKEQSTLNQMEAPVMEEGNLENAAIKMTPVARKMMKESGLSIDDLVHGLRKITAADVQSVLGKSIQSNFIETEVTREVERIKMSHLRKKISERLVAVKNETAMLTTFNEADMRAVIDLRKRYQDQFVEKHGLKLGFMSLFTKAVTEALKQYPSVNSYLDGDEIVRPAYFDIGIAVQTDKGLMVPVLRNTESLSLSGIEKQIIELAEKARKNRISMDEMTGGTFSITNGGVFGSMLSTPILNPPQSAILGMHNIIDRPVAIDGKVVIRPMMYLALSYDHRIIDGRDSVGFLKTVKEYIENPLTLLFGGNSPEKLLLDL